MFIPIEKMKKLREAAKTGDENAKKILAMQLDGKNDFSELMEDYFNPKQPESTGDAGLDQFLADNKITKENPDYQSYVDDYYKECGGSAPEPAPAGNPLIEGIISLVSVCDKSIMDCANGDEIKGAEMKGTLSTLQEVKQSLLDALEKVKGLDKKEPISNETQE